MQTIINESLKKLAEYVYRGDDNLWDGGLLYIEKTENGYEGKLIQMQFEDEESIESGRSFENEYAIEITSEIRSAFESIQAAIREKRPDLQWNTLVLEVKKDGSFEPHYELEGEEVQPDVAPAPDPMTAEYLLTNIKYCIAHNAPDNYVWVWEELHRKKTEDGKTEYGGHYYYSLNEDKSNATAMDPGEFTYPINVSLRLFEEFFAEKTNKWSRIGLYFHEKGRVQMKVFNADYIE